jgi:hypothetical protein
MRGAMIPVDELSTSGSGEHWRKRADEARSLAYDMKDEISKQMQCTGIRPGSSVHRFPRGRALSAVARPAPKY